MSSRQVLPFLPVPRSVHTALAKLAPRQGLILLDSASPMSGSPSYRRSGVDFRLSGLQIARIVCRAEECRGGRCSPAVAESRRDRRNSLKEPVAQPVEQLTFNQ
jgi:hypothetical protein